MKSVSMPFAIDLRRLQVLRMLREHGTIAATAAAVHLTPSAVSQQLASLSRETGVPLLERQGRTVTLTGQARLLLDHADTLLAHLERARAELAAYGNGDAGEVRIGAFASAITGLVAPTLDLLRRGRSGLRLTVREVEAPGCFSYLDAGELDLVITVDYRTGPPRTDARYHRLDLHCDPYDAALPTDHRFTHTTALALSDLADEQWITAAGSGPCAEVPAAAAAAAGFTPHIAHRLDDYTAALALVAAGAGITVIPRLAGITPPTGVTLKSLTYGAPVRSLYAVVRSGAQHDPRLQAVLAALTSAAQQHASHPINDHSGRVQ